MKKQLIILILMIFSFNSKAQNMRFFNESEKEELLKGGFYRVHVENSNNYILESNNGTIENNKNGNFNFQPQRIGDLTLTIKNKKGKVINQKSFKVREVIFYAYIMGSTEVISNLDRFCHTSGIYMDSHDLGCTDITYTGKYKLEIKKNDNVVYRTASDKLKWSDETRENFQKLENGDSVLIYNISFRIGNNDYEVEPISLKVKI